jgi:hypothetical protein
VKKILLSVLVPIALAAALFTLSGCTTAQQIRTFHKPVQADQFYTTSYSAELRRHYETTSLSGPNADLRDAPPRVNRFRRGERICVAIHSLSGAKYQEHHVPGWVSGFGKPEVLGTPVSFVYLFVGGLGDRWDATCILSEPLGDTTYSQSP